MRWPAGAAFEKKKNSNINTNTRRGGAPAAMDGLAAIAALMRPAQRRARMFMFAYMPRKVRPRAVQAREFCASLMGRERASFGSRPQSRKACRAMTQRSSASQPACQEVIQTMPSAVGGLCFGR
jgi:hypothetical protein